MKYRVEAIIEVDKDAWFLPSDRKGVEEAIQEEIENLLYELDLTANSIEVEEYD